MNERPRFVIISGIDGSGKTTIIRALKQRLEDAGMKTHYIWLRYNHIITKPIHAFCRLVGLSRRYDSAQGQVWRHEFYRSQTFCSIYIFLTWLDTWLGKLLLAWRLKGRDTDFVICDRWVSDILIDLAVDSRREEFLESSWRNRFQKMLPEGATSFLIVRDKEAVLECRPECKDNPDFEYRQNMYKQLQKKPGDIIVLSNNGSIEQIVGNLMVHLVGFERQLP